MAEASRYCISLRPQMCHNIKTFYDFTTSTRQRLGAAPSTKVFDISRIVIVVAFDHDSVTILRIPTRPDHNLKHRMQVIDNTTAVSECSTGFNHLKINK